MREFRETEEESETNIEQIVRTRLLTPKEREQIVRDVVTKYSVHILCDENTDSHQTLETQEIIMPAFAEIKSPKKLDVILSHYPEMQFMRSFQENFYRARIYCILFERKGCEEVDFTEGDCRKFVAEFDGISINLVRQWLNGKRKPKLIVTLEKLMVHRLYEVNNGNPVSATIESMSEVDLLIEKHPQIRTLSKYNHLYIQCQSFFEVKNDWSKTQNQLAKIYGVSHSTIGYWRSGREPRLIAELRRLEERDILNKWVLSLPITGYQRLSLEYDEFSFPKIDDSELDITIQEIESTELNDIMKQNDAKLWNESTQLAFLSELNRLITSSEASIFRINFPNGFETVIEKYRESLSVALQDQMEYDGQLQQIRVGVMHRTLFIWLRELDSDDMVDVWASQFFYFKERKDLLRLLVKARDSFELDCMMYDAMVDLNRLLQQVIEDYSPSKVSNCHEIRPMTSRLYGETLSFLLSITGASVSEIQGRISKISAHNGRGGIHNPRFLEGKELEIERAKLIAAIMSDGYVKENGRVSYCEGNPDRFDIAENCILSWGDIEVIRHQKEGTNYIETYLPSQFGIALMFWGFESGDKTIRNCGLPVIDVHSSWEARIAYARGLIPEDGCFYKSRFSWGRSVALHAGNKTKAYEFENIISKYEIEFIKKHKTHYHDDTKCYSLTWISLQELENSNDSEIVSFATKIMSKIYNHPNNLIHDEIKIVNSLGIEVALVSKKISFYEKTGKVTVHWLASTMDDEHTIRWALLCPPDDIHKKSLVRKWLLDHSELVEQIQQMNGISSCEEIDWWKN